MADKKLLESEELLVGADPSVDWTKVKVGTPILVKYKGDARWYRRDFAKYVDGRVYVHRRGTSWALGANSISHVYCAKLPDDTISGDKNSRNQKGILKSDRRSA